MTTTAPTPGSATAQTTAQTTSKEDAVSVSTAAAATAAPVGSTPATGRPTRKVNIPYASILLPLAVLAVVVAVWYLVSYVFLDESRRFLMPPPDQVVTEGLFGPNAGEMWQALWQTTKIAMTGLLIAAVVGIVWAIVMAQSKRAETALFPYAVFLQCIPVLALVPLIGFWFGFGFSARVFVCVLIALFPMVSNTLFGLQSVDPGMRDLFALHKPSRLTVLRKLELPAAMPRSSSACAPPAAWRSSARSSVTSSSSRGRRASASCWTTTAPGCSPRTCSPRSSWRPSSASSSSSSSA